jgi:hypothetical protein
MAYRNPYTGEWTDESGQPISQDPGVPSYDPYTGQEVLDPSTQQPWVNYTQAPIAAGPAPSAAPAPGPSAIEETAPPSPTPTSTGDGGTNPYTTTTSTTGGTGAFDPTGFQWPVFEAPAAFTYDPFKAPTAEDAANEPGYAFALDQGEKALQNSAAAKGTLRTGGTLKDILGFGQKFAAQNYQGAYDRSANTYQMNRNNAADVWQRAYTSSKDVFAPKERAAQSTFDALLQQWRDSLNATTSVATAGAGV